MDALTHSEELGLIKLQFDNAKCVYEACEAMGDYKQALLYYQKYKRLEDSIYSEDNAREMATQETKYAFEKQILADSLRNAKEKEVSEAMIVAQDAKIKQDRVTQLALFGGLLLVLIFAAFLYNRFQITRRQRDLIARQKEEVETKNREILQSIAYARRLQDAVLPPARVVKEFFADSFLLYLPKDIVSGDFYWMENRGSVSYFAVGDCTGHGVPGAMLSVIGLNGLNRCLNEMHITSPAAILEQLTLIFQSSFERSEATVRDGMDIGICALDNESGQLTFAGANNMLRIVRRGEVLDFKGDKRAVGFHDSAVKFSQVDIPLTKGDILLLSTDGIVDQFGGPEGKKFLNKRLRELLIRLSGRPMPEQRNALLEEFEAWRGSQEQTDDVCVMGVRV